MEEFAKIIQAIAALLWPIFAFTVLFLFKNQFTDLFKRIRKGKLFGQELELEESLDKLDESTKSIQSDIEQGQLQTKIASNDYSDNNESDIIDKIIDDATRSPKVALINLSIALEKLARDILATSGHLNGRENIHVHQAISEIHKAYELPNHTLTSLKHFWEIRNRIIHARQGSDDDVLRAIDSGIIIFKALQAMPRETSFVYIPNIDIFEDEKLETRIENIIGVMLKTISPGGVSSTLKVFPTTKNNYEKGKEVSWEWNLGLKLGPAWYKNPETGNIEKAWDSSAEFIGRHLDDL